MSSEQTKDLAESTEPKQQNSGEHADKASISSKSSSSKTSDKKESKMTATTNKESTSVEIPAQSAEANQQQKDTDQRAETATAGGQPDSVSVDSQHETSHAQYKIYRWPMRFDPVAIVFALLVFVGGLIGYFTKDSTSSLVAGTVFAWLIAVGIYFDGARKNPYPLLVTLLALAGLMFWRYSEKWAFMPSGLITLLATLMFARHAYLLYLRGQIVAS